MAEGLKVKLGVDSGEFESGLKKAEKGLNDLNRAASGARPSFVGLNQSLRDAGNFAISTQIGLLAISNNLPTLVDDFRRYQQQLSATNKESVGFLRTLKGFAGAFIGSGGLVALIGVAATALPILIGKYLQTSAAAKKATDDIKGFNDILNAATGSTLGQKAQVDALVSVFGDLNATTRDRKRALEELATINKSYFGDLNAEKVTLGELVTRANEYNEALIQQAIVKGAQAELEKLGPAFGKAAREYKAASRDYFNATQSTGDAVDKAGNRVINLDQNVAKLGERYKTSQKAFADVNSQLQEYIGLIRDATGALANFRDLQSGKGGKTPKATEVFSPLKGSLQNVNDLLRLPEDFGSAFSDQVSKDIQESFRGKVIPIAPKIIIPPSIQNQKGALEVLSNQAKEVTATFNELLAPAINTVFGALENGQSIPKALAQAFKSLLVQIALTVAKAAALAGILAIITGGSTVIGGNPVKGFGGIFKALLGGGVKTDPNFNGLGGGLQLSGGVALQLRGTDLVGAITGANAQIGRVG